jgi:hypothetical protein
MSATEQFLKTGDGMTLAGLLEQHNTISTQKLAHNIKSISQGLHLLRPLDVMQASAQLTQAIEEATPDISLTVPPFTALLKQVENDYGNFGFDTPKESKNKKEERKCLLQELKMIDWYKRKGQVVHALCLAREWIVSLLCYELNLDPLDDDNRDKMAGFLNRRNRRTSSSFLTQWNSVLEEKRNRLLRLWGGLGNQNLRQPDDPEITSLRNDVLHAGMDWRAKSTERVLMQTEAVIEELKKVAVFWLYNKEL